jgi:hypothetical protein
MDENEFLEDKDANLNKVNLKKRKNYPIYKIYGCIVE